MYDPFGVTAATTGGGGSPLGFQGDYTDPTFGEVWMGARWYSPTDAGFRSRDTVFGELTTPISLNRYTYSHNNPLLYWDPNGQSIEHFRHKLSQTPIGRRLQAAEDNKPTTPNEPPTPSQELRIRMQAAAATTSADRRGPVPCDCTLVGLRGVGYS